MECIAIDWSGATSGAGARIWIARAVGGVLAALFAPGSRGAVQDLLLERGREARPCVVGLDFAFSVPAWFAAERHWHTAHDVWCAARDDGQQWLRECHPPFWGRAGRARPHDVARGLRETERHSTGGARPKSVFQVGGAGSVGTGSIRGMPMLLALRDAGWAIWPFDAPASHTVVEIYPRLFTGPVVKRDAASRRAYLAAFDAGLAADIADTMCRSEDAFDAGISAIAMSRRVGPSPPVAITDALARIEGRIWTPG